MGSKSNTRIRVLDDIVDDVVNGAVGLSKNAERNVGTFLKDMAVSISKGNVNNVGNTILRNLANVTTGYLLNPDDTKQITGETTAERYESEQVVEGQRKEVASAQNVVDENNRAVAGIISGSLEARRRAPGKAQTLLNGSAGQTNSLLTIMGKK